MFDHQKNEREYQLMLQQDAHKLTRAASLRPRRRRVAMCALVSLLVAACGSSDDDASGPQPEDLIGTWEATGSDVRWEVTDDVITTTFGGGIETEYTATASSLEMGDDTGELACPSGQIGVYKWEINDDVLELSLVSDDCGGRGETIDGLSLERTES